MGGALEVGNMGGLHKFQSGAGFGYNQLAPGWSHNCTVPGLNPGLLCKVKSRIHLKFVAEAFAPAGRPVYMQSKNLIPIGLLQLILAELKTSIVT